MNNNWQKKLISATTVLIVFSLYGEALALSLSDIKNTPYEPAIRYWVDQGVIDGYPDGTYKPLQSINRAEFLKIVLGGAEVVVETGGNCFPDVKTDWYAPYVCRAKNLGIIEGYPDGYFHPDRTINYVEALKMLYLANGDSGQAGGPEWYSRFTGAAESDGVALQGVSYAQLMNRGQIAQLAYNYRFQDTVQTTPPVPPAITTPPATDTTVISAGSFGPQACSGTDPANGIYVSPDGNDGSADGSMSAPYKSINTALAEANPGDTVILRGGTYHEGGDVRIRQPNITLKSKNEEWAVIDLSGNYDDIGVYFDAESSGGKLQCVEVIGGFYAFSTETKWDWGEADRSGASNIIIEDSKLHGSGRDVIKIKPNSDNITVRRNEIYDSGKAQTADDCNAEGIDNVNGDKMLVQNNYIHDICSTGVYFKGGATDGIVENNKIVNTGSAGVLIGFDTSPEYFDLNVNPGYYENIRGIVRNNLIIDTGLSGIGMYASKDAQVYNNTLVNVANGDAHSAIYFGVTFQDWEEGAGRPANINPAIHDNIVAQPGAVSTPMVDIRYADELGGLSGLDGSPTMSNNCYFIEGKTAQFSDGRPGSEMEGGLTAWQAHIGGDSGSLEVDAGLGGDYMPTNAACSGRGYQK